ncbi:MAG TPA: OB-fold domain-containing protein [Solirubrobacteraceae bacterium]|jgi:hypothetical protein
MARSPEAGRREEYGWPTTEDYARAANGRLLPRRTAESDRFWASCHEGRMELQRCSQCGRFWYYPGPLCPHCSSPDYSWEPVSGNGVVHTFSWVHRPAPGFADQVPYAYALVELEEGPVLATNVTDCDEGDLHISLPVSVHYFALDPEISLPLFRPRGTDAEAGL